MAYLGSIRKGIESERWFQLMRSSPQLDTSTTLSEREIALSCAGNISTAKLVKLLKAYCLYLSKLPISFLLVLVRHFELSHLFQIQSIRNLLVITYPEKIGMQ